MALQISRIYGRTLLVSCSGSHNVCNYSRWTHRKPSNVILPLKKETVIDITEGYKDKEYFKSLRGSLKASKKSDASKNITAEKSLTSNSSTDLFDFDKIDNITNNPKGSIETDSKKKLKKLKACSNADQENKKVTKEKKEALSVFDSEGRLLYDKLENGDPKISNLIIKLKSKKLRAKCGQILVEGWRLIVDGLEAGCKLDMLLFSRIDDLEKVQPFMPATGIRLLKMPYKEMQMWSTLETSPGIVGIFQTPDSLNIPPPVDSIPLNVICDNIRDPGNMGSILRTLLGVGCENIFLTYGCVDIWDSKVLRSASGAHFRIPIEDNLSWNQICKRIEPKSSIFIADNNLENPISSQSESSENSYILSAVNIPLVPYYAVDYTKQSSITVIIGGETMGISNECYDFVNERGGARANIPITPGVNSLNSGTALAVIAFEIKRQILIGLTNSSKTQDSLSVNV